ncbi:unnamed protein product [Oncorhynchus mykiss]|uniref:Uncharacterized protein n=1 Tax=Oncorhynchus mykiss TaxID=8022 RepID=A0A060XK66_ONCMY|nr:unnamed protein product [Oncorhynchus mykiss]
MIQPCVFILLVNTVCYLVGSQSKSVSDPVPPGDSVTLHCNGTKLDTENPRRNVLIPVTFILGEALLMCIVLIIYLMYTRKNKTICDSCNAGAIPLQSGGEVPSSDQQSDQGNGEDVLQYSALTFPQNTTPAEAKSDAMGGESVYSDVKSFGWD